MKLKQSRNGARSVGTQSMGRVTSLTKRIANGIGMVDQERAIVQYDELVELGASLTFRT